MQIRPKIEEGWSTLFLLIAMVYVSAAAVPQTELIGGLDVVIAVGIIAVCAGTLLAKSRFIPNTAHLFSLIFGLFFVIYMVGTLDEFAGMVWRERILHPTDGIIYRQIIWFQKLLGGGISRDGFVFVVHTATVYWLIGYTSAWYTFRVPHVWRVVVPNGLVLLSVVYYYHGSKPLEYYLAVYMILALLFVTRTHLVEQEKQWRIGAVRYEKRIWFNFIRASFAASLVALILATWIPPLSASSTVSDALGVARTPWRQFQDNWTRMFSALRTYGAETADPYQNTLVLGGPRTVGNSPVMDVFVNRRLPYVYWQAIVYTTYQDGGWQFANDPHYEHFPDDGFINTPLTSDRQTITQTVVTYFPNSSFIFGAPEIVAADRPINVFSSPDETGASLVTSVRSKFVLQQGDQYRVTSRLSTADASSLRTASINYPDWVRETYLQVPDTITPETLALAEELMAAHDNPFDKAIAVRNFLRQNIAYNDQIEAAPEGVEPIHYTLFVSREGYCNYYASAMAIMLRSQGIPARVVSGYAQGAYEEESRSYRIRASNAHTWVEVYFPSYGWIQFEPTAAIPTVDRPEFLEAVTGGDAFDAFLSTFLEDEALERFGPGSDEFGDFERGPDLLGDAGLVEDTSLLGNFQTWQAIGATAVLIIAIVLSLVANRINRRVEADVERSYKRLGSFARWLGLALRPVHTPNERADLMVAAVPEGKDAIRTLTRQYVLKQFSRAQHYEEGFNPATIWQQLRPILLRKSIINWLQRRKRR